ncbi:MAG: ubiquinone biosynthesis protein [Anaerostipes sp.]|nr:ubiquinone biosynthesis protein [Anaerostipes sp.]MDD3745519.1 ubiquinone biosynthesis protein [Anaerostipes sp.]
MKKRWIHFVTLSMLMCMVTVTMTGCFGKDEGSTQTTTETAEDTSIADDASDAVDNAADAVDDVADDVANGFDSYDDAHDYLVNRLGQGNDGGSYEVKKRDEKVTEYKKGYKGYHYEIYDTSDSSGKKYGDFYVDKDNGKIYKKNKDTNKIEEYGNDNQ